MRLKHLRFGFVAYFVFLYIFLRIQGGMVRDLNSFYFYYFIELFILLEVVNFLLRRVKLFVEIKLAYVFLLVYTVLNSLTLAFYPEWRNITFNHIGHFIAGVIFAVVTYEILRVGIDKTKSKLSELLFFLFAFSLASTAGVFNEIIELGLDFYTGSHRLGPMPDTATDLLMNTFGIISFLIIRSFKVRVKP